MSAKTVSLVVPVYNMADYLPQLMESLRTSGVYEQLVDVILVNDGSTDDTKSAGEMLHKTWPKCTVLNLAHNSGRFIARKLGAEAAKGSHILFIDARVALRPGFGSALSELLPKHDALMGTLHIETSKSVYNLYWQRTHERIFRRNYQDQAKGFLLTADNYENYVKGTTVFLCPRDSFIKACNKFSDRTLHSDDTFLMREIVDEYPIWVDSKLSIDWEPRQGFWPFLVRLWERGPQFVEYHVFERQGLYFFLFLLWSAVVFGSLALVIFDPLLGAAVIGSGLGLIALSTALFANSPVEFVRMIPIHVGTILAYGLGAIYGVGVNLNLFRKPPPTAAQR
jgi:glycosyltransferase involved in cell wall biosynthesis